MLPLGLQSVPQASYGNACLLVAKRRTTGHLEEHFIFKRRKQAVLPPRGLGLLWPWPDVEFGPRQGKLTEQRVGSWSLCLPGKAKLAQRATSDLWSRWSSQQPQRLKEAGTARFPQPEWLPPDG